MMRRLHRALTGGEEELFALLDDPAPDVLQALLKNPRLGENHLLALLKRRDLSEEYLRQVARTSLAEESHQLKVALVRNPGTPAPLVLSLIPHLYLFELVTLCTLPGATADQKLAAERAIIQRLPTTPLGNKITLARRGTTAVVEALLLEGGNQLVEACLANPNLKEASVYRFLGSPRASAETISLVARNPRWKSRPNLRLAMLKNRLTPAVWFTLFLPGIPVAELRVFMASRTLTPPQKQAVQDEARRRGLG